jgi:hypothetical protein
MNKRKLINIIYGLIFILIVIIGVFYVFKTNVENDLELPLLEVSLDGSSVIITSSDNVGISAYTYNDTNSVPNNWYEANNKKEFNKTLKILTPGTYYIWVRDLNGNISESSTVVLNCSNGSFNKINDTVYCPYSRVSILGYYWHVLSDENGYITLFMDSNQLSEMNHCDTLPTSEYCYYISEKEYDSYSWNKSIINKYLNTDFLNSISSMISLKETSICSDRSGQSGCLEDDGCAGYLNSEINDYGYVCHNQFITSKIRLLTYIEYNEILSDLANEDKSWVYGNEKFWTMIGWNKPPYAGAIDVNGKFVVDEMTTNKLDVRPVITIKK